MSKVLAFPTTSPVVKKIPVIAEMPSSIEREYNRMRTLETFLGLANSLKEGMLDIDDPQHVAYLVRRVIETADEHKRREPKVGA